MEIREARPEEHEAAGRVVHDAYVEFLGPGADDEDEGYLRYVGAVAERAAHTTVLVALDGHDIVGCVTLELDRRTDPEDEPLGPERAHVRMLGVAPGARRRGIGRSLILACESRARAAGKSYLTLHTTHSMTAARAMYERLGYERSEDHVLPDGFVLLGYRKDLQPSTS